MDRRDFFKSMLMVPCFTPLLLAAKRSASDAEFFLLSDTPHLHLPPLLDELQTLGIIAGRSFAFHNTDTQSEALSSALVRRGWPSAPQGNKAHLNLSSRHLQAAAPPSFTLAKEGQIWDIRTRKLLFLWEELNQSSLLATLLTTVSVKNNPSSLTKGETVSFYRGGGKVKALPLDLDRAMSFETKNGSITVKIEKGKVWVTEASCRHKICIHCPPASHPGERIICAPSRIFLEINGSPSVDTIIG